VAPRRHYGHELNSSPISDENNELLLMLYNRATTHTEQHSTIRASTNLLKDHVKKYFNNCSNDGRYNMKRRADEDIPRYFERMVDDAMAYWNSGPVALKEVAKSILIYFECSGQQRLRRASFQWYQGYTDRYTS
jgi:hypothetical protein